jgi:hypothetical protein
MYERVVDEGCCEEVVKKRAQKKEIRARLVRLTRRRDNATMRLVILAAVAACNFLASCASQEVVERFDRVKPGMTRDEVVAMLGAPSSTWALVAKRDGIDGERLQWGDGLSSLASGAAFDGEPDRTYCVVFDKDGKVVRAAPPSWVAAEAAESDLLRARRDERAAQP